MRHLKAMLGFDLFDRVKGRLVPPDEAKMLFRQAQDIFAALPDGGGDPTQSARLTDSGSDAEIGNSILPAAIAVNPFSLPTICTQPWTRAPMVCVLAKNDPLAALDVISPIEISDLPLISFSRQTVLARQIEAAFAKHGFVGHGNDTARQRLAPPRAGASGMPASLFAPTRA
jgi:DNA-binding transcriptional LysR family regulator